MEDVPKKKDNRKNVVFYDGTCPMCTALVGKIAASPKKDAFDLKTISGAALPAGISRAEAEKEIHLVGADGRTYKGSEAMVKILEEYSGSRFWGKIAGLPVVKQLLALGYRFIAANRYFIFGPRSRIFYLKIVLALAFIAGFLLSVKLWLSTRFYPLSPVLKIFPTIPYPFDHIYFYILLALLVTIIFLPRPRGVIVAFAVLLVILGLLDQSRWQPWAYQYLFMLIGLGLFSWRPDDARGGEHALNVSRIIVAATYVWSGIQKLNISFLVNVFPWLLGPLFKWFPVLGLLGPLVPLAEIGIGIGLFAKRYRNIAVWAAVLMHIGIFFALGPLWLNWNSVVWPWQIAMVLFVLLLFYKTDFGVSDLLSRTNRNISKIVLVLFLIMPFFSLFGLWDSYLSASLYSGNITQGTIYIDNAARNALPPAIAQYATSTSPGESAINIADWSFGEMNAPPYPETRIYENVARSICGYADDPLAVTLTVQEKQTLLNGYNNVESYDCADLNE